MGADQRSSGFETRYGVLEIAMSDGGGADDQRAIGNGLSDGFKFFGVEEHGGGAHGGAGALESDFVRVNHAQAGESEIAHGAGCGANVERVADVHKNDAQIVEFRGDGQVEFILRQMVWRPGRRTEPEALLFQVGSRGPCDEAPGANSSRTALHAFSIEEFGSTPSAVGSNDRGVKM